MCGRYSLNTTKEALQERYKAKVMMESVEGSEEIFPTDTNLILLPNQRLYPVKWGFTPSFSKQPIINARAETILEKPTFKEPFSSKRCIIPATSFFEWQEIESNPKKVKKEIFIKDQEIFSIAGICERYVDDRNRSILTYTMLTTEANEQMKSIHHRMPVILELKDEERYLNLTNVPSELTKLLQPSTLELEIK